MKTDRELLELAAKAAGMSDPGGVRSDGAWWWYNSSMDGQGVVWSPLTDDGDTARLEALLEIDVAWMSRTVTSQHLSGHVLCSVSESFSEHEADKAKARRYASVRVAAAIGEQME